jgi:hypothetical protein
MQLLRAATRGALTGVLGTLAMDLLWFARYKQGGGQSNMLTWELAVGLSSWDDAPAPAKVGKLFYEGVLRRELPASRAALTTNVMHWGYGIQWGMLFGLSMGSPHAVRLWHGPLLGALVWLAGYTILPIAGIYKPIWTYGLKSLWDDLSAHLVYGTSLAVAFALPDRPASRGSS